MSNGKGWQPDVKELRKLLDAEPWCDKDCRAGHDKTDKCRAVYVGSVLRMSPSGKVYMPWSSNVTQEEADSDEEWSESVGKKLSKARMYLFSGEGDPCDQFVGESGSRDDDEDVDNEEENKKEEE